ncbi:MAG: type 4a pilus biogenesis protein PilO [Gammaproteobacteria bacterium]
MSFADDLKNLDPNNPGAWPLAVQMLVLAAVFVLLLFAGWKFDITKQREELATLQSQESQKITTLEKKQKQAANLPALKEQMKEMEQSFGDMVRQLPNKTEVAGLLIDVSQTGLASGLEFKLFEPKAESRKEFYSELPINISVTGSYHQFGEFISGVAALPRIVTTHEISIEGSKGKDPKALVMKAIAKTYRALEE